MATLCSAPRPRRNRAPPLVPTAKGPSARKADDRRIVTWRGRYFSGGKNTYRACQPRTNKANFSRMKCPVCELFGRELHFQTRRLLDQHSSRFHGLSAAQLQDRDLDDHPEANQPIEKSESLRARRFL